MKSYNIPIFVPHSGCPHDCVFCNQKRITGADRSVTAREVSDAIEKHLKTLPQNGRRVEAAFFGGSFTGIPIEEQTELLAAAYEFLKKGRIDGIRLSTRPDYITKEILDNLLRYGVTTIELGVQSMDDEVLRLSNRGHKSSDVVSAVKLIRKYPFTLGVQMMTGLPGDTKAKAIHTADALVALKPDLARIYPTLTIRDTKLEELYRRGEYAPQTVSEAARLCKELVLRFEAAGVKVIRVGLQATDEISEGGGSVVAGPIHSAFGELVENEIYLDLILRSLEKCNEKTAVIYVNPREISKATGNRRCNIIKIKQQTGIDITIRADGNLQKREVICDCC